MSDYIIAVDWAGKDALSDSNAAKVISGADFNSEFTAARTAINSKADLNGDATESFNATTANAGTNTTQVATTAFVTAALTAVKAALYPVGSIYTNAAVSTNPATLLGFGTWAAYAEGRVPVGKAGSGTFDTLNAQGGAETDTLSIAEMPSHNHSLSPALTRGLGTDGDPDKASGGGSNGSFTISSTGGGGAHNNLQPYIVVYMWKRTA